MKAQDLCIGNYVKFGTRIYKVDKLEKGFVLITNPNDEKNYAILDYGSISGIELTEDILFKIGFNNVRNNMLVNHKEYHNNKINEGAFYVEPVGDAFNHWYLYHKVKMITSNIRFVHQLQNLYFALTGEELTIKN